MGTKVPFVMNPPDRLGSRRFDARRLSRGALVLVLFLLTFSLLDKLAQGLQLFPGVVAWYPPDGLSLAFLLTFGAAFAPVLTIASVISSLSIFQFSVVLGPLLIWAVILSTAYGTVAWFLRGRIRIDPQLRELRDTLWLIAASAIVSALLAAISISILVSYGDVPRSQVVIAFAEWWIGEMIGVLVLTPFLLVHVMPAVKGFIDRGWDPSRRPRRFHGPSRQTIGQVISIPVTLYLALGVPALAVFHPMYLIAMPLLWVALEKGFSGATSAIVATNFGAILAIWLFHIDASNLAEHQFMLFVISAGTLLTGAIVTKEKRIELQLREREVRNRALIENAPDAITLVGADGLTSYASPSTQRILGYAPEEQLGSNPAEFAHPDDLPALQAAMQAVDQEPGKLVIAEYRVRHKDGSWRWLASSLTNLLAEPSVAAVVFNFRDITERKLAAETLQASEQWFRALVENSLEEVSLVDAQGVLTFESPSTQRPLGYPPGSFVGHNILDLFHSDDRADAVRLLEQIVRAPGDTQEAEFRLRHQDGSWRWMQGFLTNLLDEPAVRSIVINYRDITARKLAEQEIASLAKFPAENPNPELRLSRDGILMYANPPSRPLLDLWGCEVGGSVPQFWHDLAVRLLASDANEIVEVECNGKVYSISIAPVSRAGYVNLYGRDITARKQAEEGIKVSNAELSMLFELSHSLAAADSLEAVLDAVNRHAVESVHTTFARIALLEEGRFVVRAAYPVREVNHDLEVGERYPASSLPHTQRMLQQNTPVVLRASDTGISPEEMQHLLLDFVQTLCLVPLRSTDSSPTPENLLGFLMLGEVRNPQREPFTPAKIRLAQSIGDSAASAIRRMLLTEQTARRLKQSIALTEIDLAIISTSDMVFSLQVLLQHATERLNVDAAAAWWFNPATQALEFVAGRGFRTPAFKDAKPVSLGEGHVGRAALERRMIHIPDLALGNDNPRLAKALEGEPFVGYYAVPLVVKDQVKGVLEIFHRTELESSEEWLNFLNALANQAAIAIDNSSLFNDLQHSNTELTDAYDATIRGWSRALDLRDQETEGHTQRVTELTMNLARRFGLSEEELVHVRRGALLHDIGKMGVPDAILLKPGPLTDEEWVQMRKHPGLAHEMLSPIQYLNAALDIPYCHHEKWDGSGYPRGLKGEEIPLAARIFAVIDVYDALTSDRPYRKAWTVEKTLQHIRAGVGTHFDPKVVEMFLKAGILQPA